MADKNNHIVLNEAAEMERLISEEINERSDFVKTGFAKHIKSVADVVDNHVVVPGFTFSRSDLADVQVSVENTDSGTMYTYSWEPKEAQFVFMSTPFVFDSHMHYSSYDDVVQIGPFLLKFIAYDPIREAFVLMRTGIVDYVK